MAVKTVEQYYESLRQVNPVTYILGERVNNAIDHPLIKGQVAAVAQTYALVKDPEGSELLVPRGAKESLRRNDVQLFCEVPHDFLRQLGQSVHQIAEYLEKLGYEVHGVSLGYLTISHVFEGAEYLYAKKTLHNIV